jgi:hypothetical protein
MRRLEMIGKDTRRRRLLVNGAIAITVAAATSAGVALAGSGGSGSSPTQAVTTADTGNGVNNEFHQALQSLVADGTISQAQADVIREQGDTASVDPRALVANGVVTAAQMSKVAARLDGVKRDLENRLGGPVR